MNEIHPLLLRQIKRVGIDMEKDSIASTFLELFGKISKAYTESDQERYTIERSMEISSKEMMELRQKIQHEKNVLITVNHDLTREIEERKKAESKNLELTKKLMIASRQAGMADTATSVLHNIGNVLNSINTSSFIVCEMITYSKMSNLEDVKKLILSHQKNLAEFITQDPKGKHLPNYLLKLSDLWTEEKSKMTKELISLQNNIHLIKETITKQNFLSKAMGVTEKVDIKQVIEDALLLAKGGEKVRIIKELAPVNKTITDRVKLLQVLLNLIKNSFESLREVKHDDKWIKLRTLENDPSSFTIQVIDNGVGILMENFNKIFTFGFTTKKEGHGFGLHSSANAIHELGGKMSVDSKGPNEGATFTITLPYHSSKIKGGCHVQR